MLLDCSPAQMLTTRSSSATQTRASGQLSLPDFILNILFETIKKPALSGVACRVWRPGQAETDRASFKRNKELLYYPPP